MHETRTNEIIGGHASLLFRDLHPVRQFCATHLIDVAIARRPVLTRKGRDKIIIG